MRKLILLSALLICSIGVCFGQLVAKVDERIELTGVVFRLAQIPEYTQGAIDQYNEAIDKYFYDYRYDPVIEYVIKLRNEYGLGYSAVAGSTLALSIENGHVIQSPCFLKSELPDLGSKWKDDETFEKYVELLDDFYVKSNFRKFFDEHQELYSEIEAGINELLIDFNSKWFTDFFGVEFQCPAVYVCAGNGPSNYYIVDYESNTDYAILLGGRQHYSYEYTLPTIIHEICHNYSNPLFYKYSNQMEPAAKKIYEDVKEEMLNNAYGSWSDTAREWQNNLCTAMYLRDNMPLIKNFWIGELRDRGFIWLPRSVQFAENFYANREKYPHFDSFMPQLVSFLNYTADDYERIKFEFENQYPYIVSVFPANNSNIKGCNFSEIRVTFSQSMSPYVYSVGVVKDDASFSRIPRSETIDAYWVDDYTFVIPIEPSLIENNKKYGILLGRRAFMTPVYSKMKEDYIITYKTCE